ncbi:MAG TPA: GNAT family N-acetyltransferase [Fimbriiglobus sp.]|nr:GNAT family N-acetyltransferase [Fimbriiglobus sp.]
MDEPMTPTIRHETPADHEAVRQVNRLAFGQDDEAGIVEALRTGGYVRVSLVAEVAGRVVGHILFSEVPILTHGGTVPALSLAPMAVLPEFQRRGIGSALVEKGLEACRDQGRCIVVVLGHPDFYPRFGFSPKLAETLSNPFHGGEAWMALELVPGSLGGVIGWVRYPPPFGAGVQVRPVYRPDRAEWVRMRTALWPDDGGAGHGDDVDAFFATGTFRSSESLLPWKVLVAERPAGGLCGFVEASIRPFAEDCTTRPVGYVEGWFVDPDMRRRGVGRKLVKAAEEWAAAHGCREVASDALLENAVSHEAHKALGFEESGRLVHFRKRLDGSPEEAAGHHLVTLRLTGEQADLVAPLFDAYRQFYGQPSDPDGARRFLAERLGRGESVILAVVEGGRALGFTQLYPSFSSVSMRPIWILNDLFVAEDSRGRGVGARLLGAARDHALRTGAARLALSTAVTNAKAHALYERDGWRRDTAFLHYEYELPKDGR